MPVYRLADRVWQHCGRDTASYTANASRATGFVTVASDQGPCRSCRNVIKDFTKEFPNVEVTIRYPKRDERTTQSATHGGVYGYDDAVADKGHWQARRKGTQRHE